MNRLNCTLIATAIATAFLAVTSHAAEETNQAYREGFNLMLQERWAEAKERFQRFSEQYPDSALRDDAEYWNCYTDEREQSNPQTQFSCYEQFLETWQDSNWVNDARERMMIIANRLARQGQPQYIELALKGVEEELARASIVIENSAREGIRAAQEQMRVLVGPDGDTMRVLQDELVRVQDRIVSNLRGINEDRELLAILAILRDDPRAGELLMARFEETDDPGLQARLVLMLEGLEGEDITAFLMDLAQNDEDERVRRNAANALVDRNDPAAADVLRQIALSPQYPVSTRVAVVSRADRWAGDGALPFLSQILTSTGEPRLVATATESLLWMRTDAAEEVLINAYGSIDDVALRHEMLEQMDDWAAENLLGFLTEVALTPGDDRAAAIAVENIAEGENAMAVAALDNIYQNTTSKQLHLAIIRGVGEAETQQSVDFLAGVIASRPDIDYLAAAARALGETELESAVPLVMEIYRSSDDASVRNQAMRALRGLEEYPQSREFMVEVLEDQLNSLN